MIRNNIGPEVIRQHLEELRVLAATPRRAKPVPARRWRKRS